MAGKVLRKFRLVHSADSPRACSEVRLFQNRFVLQAAYSLLYGFPGGDSSSSMALTNFKSIMISGALLSAGYPLMLTTNIQRLNYLGRQTGAASIVCNGP
jgi:hypothetical protein